MSRRRESCVPVPRKAHIHAVSKKNVRFSQRWGKLRPGAGKAVSRRRGKLCPGTGKAVSRRRGKVTFITIEEKCVGSPGAGGSCVPAPGKLFSGAGAKSHSRTLEEKCVGFPGARGCARRRKVLERGSGKVPRECHFVGAGGSCVPALGKLFPGAGAKSHSRTLEEKCVGFPGAGGSCVLCPGAGKLFPGAKSVGFPGAGGSCVPAPGKLFPGAGESCVPTPGKAHSHSVSKKNG